MVNDVVDVLDADEGRCEIGDGVSEDVCMAIAFIGKALAPFFLWEPNSPEARPAIEAMMSLDVIEAAKAWPFVSSDLAERELSTLKTALKLLDEEPLSDSKNSLLWEYRRLFVGPGHKAASPWGSVYTDKDSVQFGETTLQLRSWLRGCGLGCLVEDSVPDDHIGRMLGLMAWIAENRPELLRDYLQNHLFTWAFRFFDVLGVESSEDFYRALARLASMSLAGIRNELGIDVRPVRFYR